MSISSVSAYSQLQNWSAKQKIYTDNVIGTNSDAGTADYSGAFASVTANYYSGMANVAALSALSRVKSTIQNKYSGGNVSLTSGAAASKAAGNAVLAQLGYTSPSGYTTSSGKYRAPINSSTGYSYIKTSAASVNSLNALNLFA